MAHMSTTDKRVRALIHCATSRSSTSVDGVGRQWCTAVINRQSRPGAQVRFLAEMAQLEETLDVLSDPRVVAELHALRLTTGSARRLSQISVDNESSGTPEA